MPLFYPATCEWVCYSHLLDWSKCLLHWIGTFIRKLARFSPHGLFPTLAEPNLLLHQNRKRNKCVLSDIDLTQRTCSLQFCAYHTPASRLNIWANNSNRNWLFFARDNRAYGVFDLSWTCTIGMLYVHWCRSTFSLSQVKILSYWVR